MYNHYFPYPYYPPLYYPYPISERFPHHPYDDYSEFYFPSYNETYRPFEHMEQHDSQSKFEEDHHFLFPEAEDPDERQDFGSSPYVVNIEKAAERNRAFIRAIWTGKHLQVTLMSIRPGEDIGLEVHRNTDQFLRIEEGRALVQMGDRRDQLNFERRVSEDDAILIPAGKWHNIINTGRKPLKLYSIYAPPEHRHGTIHRTKQDAMAAHGH